MKLAYKKQVSFSFEEAVAKTKAALSSEGFGLITEMDAKAIFKKKLDVDFENYAILGVCNPQSAHDILTMEKDMGLFLPCNIVVYEDAGTVQISAILPTVAMGMIEDPALLAIAKQIEGKLKKIIDVI